MSSSARPDSFLWLLPVVAVALAGPAAAQLTPAPVLKLRPAMEMAMPTEPGRVYQWQSSADLQSWSNVGDPVFGTGDPAIQPVTGSKTQFFRLQVVDAPAMGNAPWILENATIQLNEGPRTVRYSFSANNKGTSVTGSTTKSFTWAWLRDGLNCGRAELTFADATKDVVQLRYTAPKVGQFCRQSFTGTRLDNTDDGAFGPAPVAGASLVPASILNRPMAFSGLNAGGGLTLTAPGGGTRFIDGTSAPFSGNWLVTGGATARLTAAFGPEHGEDYRFTFTSPLTGRYTRQTFTEGVYRDEDEGTFCLNAAP